MGSDVDTNNAIIGSICDAFYGLLNRTIVEEVYARIPKHFATVTTRFVKQYIDKDFVEPKDIGNKAATFKDRLASFI